MGKAELEQSIRKICPACNTELIKSSGGGPRDRDCPNCKIRIVNRNVFSPTRRLGCVDCKRWVHHAFEYVVKDGRIFCVECIVKIKEQS